MSTGPSYVPDPSFTMFSGGPEPCRGAIGCSHKHGIVGSGTGHCCSLCTAQAGHQTDQCCSGSTACTDCIRSHCRSPCKDRRSQTTAAWQSTEISWSYWVPRILGASKIDSAAARQVSNPLHARRRSAELCSGGKQTRICSNSKGFQSNINPYLYLVIWSNFALTVSSKMARWHALFAQMLLLHVCTQVCRCFESL